jgi:homoserine kinase
MGALGCSISGAGPAIFALCQEKLQATDIAAAMLKVYEDHKLEAKSFVGAIHPEGTILR